MTKIIGTDDVGTVALTGNFLIHSRFVALSDGVVSVLNLYSMSSGNCKAAVYEDNGGVPSTRIAVNNDGVPFIANKWNSIPLEGNAKIVEGQYYWLSFLTDTTGVSVRTTTPGDSLYNARSYSAGMPDPAVYGANLGSESSIRAYNTAYTVNAVQEGDVLMLMVDDRGEIEESDGFITMTGSFETMILLTLFGGNEDDNKSESTEKLQWWGNEGESVENQYRSRFQHECSRGRPVTSSSMATFVEAAENDVKDAFIATGYAESVSVEEVEIVNPKRIRVAGFITLDDGTTVPFDVEGDI